MFLWRKCCSSNLHSFLPTQQLSFSTRSQNLFAVKNVLCCCLWPNNKATSALIFHSRRKPRWWRWLLFLQGCYPRSPHNAVKMHHPITSIPAGSYMRWYSGKNGFSSERKYPWSVFPQVSASSKPGSLWHAMKSGYLCHRCVIKTRPSSREKQNILNSLRVSKKVLTWFLLS